MAGKTVIVTGANTGMGLVISKELALQGADVIMACRSEDRGLASLAQVEAVLAEQKRTSDSTGSATLELMDLADLESVRKFASTVQDKYSHVDRLICNAGIMIPPHSFTKDGYESQFQVNHLSHYLLQRLLMPQLLSSPTRPSIVHVSSLAGENAAIRQGEFWKVARRNPDEYNSMVAYCQSKLAQVLFTVETSRRYGDQVTVNAVHPGIVNTDLFNRNVTGFVKQALDSLGKLMESAGVVYSSEKGASTAIYLATNPSSVTSTGGYWADCAPRPANPTAFNRDIGMEWWEQSAKAAGLDD